MHSLIIAVTCVAMAALSEAGFGSSVKEALVPLAFGVALLGVPHGALDPVAGKRLFSQMTYSWWVPFFAGYLAVGMIVICGWYIAPVFTCLIFFAFSAWHFGLEEDYANPTRSKFLGNLFALSRGSLIIVAVSVCQPSETQMVLSQIMPSKSVQSASSVIDLVQLGAVALVPFALVDFVGWIQSAKAGWLNVLARTSSILLLTASANPLVSFGVYFCGWHSVRGLRELWAEEGGSLMEFMLKLAPLTLATLLLGLAAFVFWSRSEVFTPSMLRVVFIGLSAIAVPHLMLHTAYRWVNDVQIESRKSKDLAICN